MFTEVLSEIPPMCQVEFGIDSNLGALPVPKSPIPLAQNYVGRDSQDNLRFIRLAAPHATLTLVTIVFVLRSRYTSPRASSTQSSLDHSRSLPGLVQ